MEITFFKKKISLYLPLVLISFGNIILVILVLSFVSKNYKLNLKEQVLIKKIPSVFLSGQINLNGVIPQGTTISVAEKEFGKTDFSIVQDSLPATDGIGWSLDDVKNDTAYYIEAYLMLNGKKIATSERKIVIAPATEELLTINTISQDEINQENTFLSGFLDLNGYLPFGGTIAIMVRKAGEPEFSPILLGLRLIDSGSWNWTGALRGVTYEIQAVLSGSDKSVISRSQVLLVTAPAFNEILKIDSRAKSPFSNFVAVSGKIDFNGNIPQNSTISISQRQSGKTEFKVFAAGLPVANGVSWTFDKAKPGVSYDFQAYLITGGQVKSQSEVLTAAAPAVNETLSLATVQLP